MCLLHYYLWLSLPSEVMASYLLSALNMVESSYFGLGDLEVSAWLLVLCLVDEFSPLSVVLVKVLVTLWSLIDCLRLTFKVFQISYRKCTLLHL